MVQIRHPSAGTTKATRRNIQNSQKSIAKLAKQYGIDPKTVVKWKKRDFVQYASREPKTSRRRLKLKTAFKIVQRFLLQFEEMSASFPLSLQSVSAN